MPNLVCNHRFVFNSLVIALLASAATVCMAAPPALETTDAGWFVAKVKTVVDEGQLFYPQQVERTLGLQIRRTDEERIAQPPQCSMPSDERSVISTRFEIANGWFKPGSNSLQDMKIPRAFINPATVVGRPAINYSMHDITYCQGDRNVLRRTEAELSFGGLSGFACLTPGQLKTLMNAESIQATDGVSISRYAAPGNDLYQTTVDFVFRMGAPCAVTATIRQDSRLGYRQLRAEAKSKSCGDSFIRRFCATLPNLLLTNLDRLDEDRIKACGTLESFFQNEPSTGLPPPPEPKRNPGTLLCPEK
jgi:hypothetical protein